MAKAEDGIGPLLVELARFFRDTSPGVPLFGLVVVPIFADGTAMLNSALTVKPGVHAPPETREKLERLVVELAHNAICSKLQEGLDNPAAAMTIHSDEKGAVTVTAHNPTKS